MTGAVDKLFDYQLTCIGGLEDVVVDEIRERLGTSATSVRAEKGPVGRVFLRFEGSPRRLLDLGCPTGLAAIARAAHDVTVGRPGLERIERLLHAIPADAVRRIARACDPQVDVAGYDLSVALRGAHRFTPDAVRARAGDILRTRLGFCGQRPGGIRLSLQVQGRRALVSVALGGQRPHGDPTREGWRGPALACVVRLLDLAAPDRIVAVAGGAGRAQAWLTAGPAGRGGVVCVRPDRLPLVDGAAAVVLVVPGVGETDLARALGECARGVVAGGVAGLLVAHPEPLAASLARRDQPFAVMAAVPWYVRRRRWVLFLLERLDLVAIAGVS